MNKPLVSIVVPVYNTKAYLSECIESLLAQAGRHEIILVDDGSTDGSGNVCDEYAKNNPEIIIAIHRSNRGVSATRNIGISKAKGKYIMFVDSDDTIDPGLIKTLLSKQTDGQEADIITSKLVYGKRSNRTHYGNSSMALSADAALQELFYQRHLDNSSCAKLYKKEAVGHVRFKPGLMLAEDLLFNIEVLINCSKVIVTSERLYYYRQHRESSIKSADIGKRIRGIDVLLGVESIIDDMDSLSVEKAYQNRIFVESMKCTLYTDEWRSEPMNKCKKYIKSKSRVVLLDSASPKKFRMLAALSAINTYLAIFMYRRYAKTKAIE